MTKAEDIDEIMAVPQYDLMLQVLWDDVAIQTKIRKYLGTISDGNMGNYHKQFRPDKHQTGKP